MMPIMTVLFDREIHVHYGFINVYPGQCEDDLTDFGMSNFQILWIS